MSTENENLVSPTQAVPQLRTLATDLGNPTRHVTNADIALIARVLADQIVAANPGLFQPALVF